MIFASVIVTTAITKITILTHSTPRSIYIPNILIETTNAAIFGTTDMYPANGADAPSYTSGAQVWKGKRESLNANATSKSIAAPKTAIISPVSFKRVDITSATL